MLALRFSLLQLLLAAGRRGSTNGARNDVIHCRQQAHPYSVVSPKPSPRQARIVNRLPAGNIIQLLILASSLNSHLPCFIRSTTLQLAPSACWPYGSIFRSLHLITNAIEVPCPSSLFAFITITCPSLYCSIQALLLCLWGCRNKPWTQA